MEFTREQLIALARGLGEPWGDAIAAMLEAQPADAGYAAGRAAVCAELRAVVDKFNDDDDSLGIGQLIEVIAPWLEEQPLVTSVVDEVIAERQRQDEHWGGPAHDDTHTLFDWWGFMRSRMVGRAYPGGKADERRDLIQIAALAVAAVESMDRKARGEA